MSSLSPSCPGANLLAGPPGIGPSVVCRPLANDRDKEGQGRFQEKERAVIFTAEKEPRTLYGYCCAGYTECLIWQAEKDRIAAGVETFGDVSEFGED